MTPEALQEIKIHFSSIEIPKKLQYNESTFMNDVKKVITSDIYTLETYGFKPTFEGSWDRLINIKRMIEEGKGEY